MPQTPRQSPAPHGNPSPRRTRRFRVRSGNRTSPPAVQANRNDENQRPVTQPYSRSHQHIFPEPSGAFSLSRNHQSIFGAAMIDAAIRARREAMELAIIADRLEYLASQPGSTPEARTSAARVSQLAERAYKEARALLIASERLCLREVIGKFLSDFCPVCGIVLLFPEVLPELVMLPLIGGEPVVVSIVHADLFLGPHSGVRTCYRDTSAKELAFLLRGRFLVDGISPRIKGLLGMACKDSLFLFEGDQQTDRILSDRMSNTSRSGAENVHNHESAKISYDDEQLDWITPLDIGPPLIPLNVNCPEKPVFYTPPGSPCGSPEGSVYYTPMSSPTSAADEDFRPDPNRPSTSAVVPPAVEDVTDDIDTQPPLQKNDNMPGQKLSQPDAITCGIQASNMAPIFVIGMREEVRSENSGQSYYSDELCDDSSRSGQDNATLPPALHREQHTREFNISLASWRLNSGNETSLKREASPSPTEREFNTQHIQMPNDNRFRNPAGIRRRRRPQRVSFGLPRLPPVVNRGYDENQRPVIQGRAATAQPFFHATVFRPPMQYPQTAWIAEPTLQTQTFWTPPQIVQQTASQIMQRAREAVRIARMVELFALAVRSHGTTLEEIEAVREAVAQSRQELAAAQDALNRIQMGYVRGHEV
ncbi:hypothetical protein V8F20_012313 [Naviculisporaceae sp. PSN 640]